MTRYPDAGGPLLAVRAGKPFAQASGARCFTAAGLSGHSRDGKRRRYTP